MASVRGIALSVLLASSSACQKSEPADASNPDAATRSCAEEARIGGACAGVPSSDVCAGAVCTEGVTCASVKKVQTDAELTAATGAATAGTCIALAPGTYGLAALPAGVSLLGKNAATTTLTRITSAGGDVTIRGLAAKGDAIVITGPGAAVVDRVLSTGSKGVGIYAADASLTLRATTVMESEDSGVVATCKADCTVRKKVSLDSVLVLKAAKVGVLLNGVDAELHGVEIDDIREQVFAYGRGIQLTDASLVAANVSITRTREFAIHSKSSTGHLGPRFAAIDNQRIGVAIVDATEFSLDGFELRRNGGVALALARSKKVTLKNGAIAATREYKVPVDVGSQQSIGDALDWVDSEVDLASSVAIDDSWRFPIVIESLAGTATGSCNAKLGPSDATKGIVYQGPTETLPAGLTIDPSIKVDVRPTAKRVPMFRP